MKHSGVYCLTSPNGKRYIGISKNINKRWSYYRCYCCLSQIKLYYALKKYGAENFKYEVILETNDMERAGNVEKQLIALWNLRNDRFGYNIEEGGHQSSPPSMLGKKHSDETKAKISAANKGYKRSDESKARMSNATKGKKRNSLSPEHKAKISAALKDKKKSPEHIAKVSAAIKGRIVSSETRAKISAAMKER